MTSDNVIVSIKLCPEAGNDESIDVCNFSGHRMSGFEVLEAGPPSPLPPVRKKQKRPVGIGRQNLWQNMFKKLLNDYYTNS